jgi:hypothetical protein
MLGLAAVDVHGLRVRDGKHEHGRVGGLALVIAALAFAAAVSGA